ncbi:MAG: hypothetical protein KDK51_09120 [Deltaproteobacteria bacterium]|nr:hypothetical protein [Deltaproteobacteria bacterium]
MKKILLKFVLLSCLQILFVEPANCIERLISIGQSVSFPRYFQPEATGKNRSYHLDVGYFFFFFLHIALSFKFALDGDKQTHIRFGPEFYLLKDRSFLPWIGAKYIYTLDPSSNQGWLTQLGVEKKLDFIFGFENMVIRASTGFAYIYVNDADDRSYFEILNMGFMFAI